MISGGCCTVLRSARDPRRFPRLLAAVAVIVLLVPVTLAAEAVGDAERGREAFSRLSCGRCHVARPQQGVGPALEELRRPQGTYELAGRLWNHAPAMFTVLTQQAIDWPRMTAADMADIMAYLQADPARDPAPDILKGQLVLVGKGCLKCHNFRREGGRVGRDLAEARPEYGSAAAWASLMWNHAPGMAATALERGVMYPRFSGAEMEHLVAFLRSGGGP